MGSEDNVSQWGLGAQPWRERAGGAPATPLSPGCYVILPSLTLHMARYYITLLLVSLHIV